MARIKDAILAKDTAYAGNSPTMNLAYGGQQGYMPRIGTISEDGKVYEEWVSNHSYVSRNIIPILIRAPKFFDYMNEPDKWKETFKALIELHPMAITGLTSGLTAEFDEHEIGGGGEMQEELTDVKRARSAINYTFKEKANKAITKFFDIFIRYGMMDPDTKKPLVANLIESLDEIGGLYTPDFYTATVLFIEPDVTQKVVVDAWLTTNMGPKGNGDRVGKREIKSAGESPELSIDWTGITLNTEAVIKMAQLILEGLTVISKVPDTEMQLPATEIDGALESAKTGFNE